MRKARIARITAALLTSGMMLVATPAAAGAAEDGGGWFPNTWLNEIDVVSCRYETLSHGSFGYCVGVLQEALNVELGSSLDVDWDFGSRTEAAVRRFQTRYGLDVDGVVGPQTWGQLIECLNRPVDPSWPL